MEAAPDSPCDGDCNSSQLCDTTCVSQQGNAIPPPCRTTSCDTRGVAKRRCNTLTLPQAAPAMPVRAPKTVTMGTHVASLDAGNARTGTVFLGYISEKSIINQSVIIDPYNQRHPFCQAFLRATHSSTLTQLPWSLFLRPAAAAFSFDDKHLRGLLLHAHAE